MGSPSAAGTSIHIQSPGLFQLPTKLRALTKPDGDRRTKRTCASELLRRNECHLLMFGTEATHRPQAQEWTSRMRALVWRGTADIRCERVPDPEIEDDRDAIIKVTSCAICGSDLHLFDHFMPGMKSGDIMGHETMGEVVEVGPGAKDALRVGERVVIPFTIICGECEQCKRGNFSVCERSNRNKQLGDKVFGHSTVELFGYAHLTDGYPGGP